VLALACAANWHFALNGQPNTVAEHELWLVSVALTLAAKARPSTRRSALCPTSGPAICTASRMESGHEPA
jgi:hypothetical protein